jgi:glycosyltransferase involved in cell wall biosynthesis
MKVAIINITKGGMSGGYRKYLRNIIPRMARNPAVDALLCASPVLLRVHNWFDLIPNVEFIDWQPFRFGGIGRNFELYMKIGNFSPDVIFVPSERYFRFNKIPVVNMIQNMEALICPNGGNPVLEVMKNLLRAEMARRAVRKTDRVIAISKFVEEFLVKIWAIPSEKISTIYYGTDLTDGKKGIKPPSVPRDWEGRFLFTAGSIRPARGLEDLLSAMKHLVSENAEIPGISIAGEADGRMNAYQKELRSWIEKHHLTSKIYWAGSLSEEEMAWCYQNCGIFVMTSRVESFGQIALESMTNGCICVAADNPCLPEIFGDAAIYYPPKDGKALAETLRDVVAWSSHKRDEVSERAREQAAKFSWDVCAEKTIAALTKAARK